MKNYNIALYPGDGIGREVVPEAIKSLDAVSDACGFKLEYTQFDWGCDYYEHKGKVVPDDYLDILSGFDAIFLGALGDPARLPDHITLRPLIEIRQSFDQYACLRPANLLPGIATPLAGRQAGDIDMLVLRENCEGEYLDVGGFFKHNREEGVAVQVALHSRKGIERILRYGFKLAEERRRHLTMTTKSNALKYGMVYWDEVFEEVRKDYPNVRADKCHVDALAMNFVRWPDKYDVVVASNLFGDILSDLAGAISGGLGLAPSASVNPQKQFPSLFEPVHGSALDIAGKNMANPIGAIRSAAMMLDFLGERTAALLIDRSVESCLKSGTARTADLGGSDTTSDMGDDIATRIRRDA
ncbi:MAG: tartrate dehydrogenase [Pirellulales bacterium]|nr:tartrate dehydrogenase [Pirellulales bacterium]